MSGGWQGDPRGASSGGSAGGWSGDPRAVQAPSATSKSGGGGGGLLGGIESGAHFIANKVGVAAHDVKAIPGGLVKLGELEGQALYHDAGQAIHHPLRTQSLHSFVHGNSPASKQLGGAEVGMAKASYASIKHPLRDPFMTALTVLPVLGAAGRLGETGLAARGIIPAAEEPRLIATGDTQVGLHTSKTPLIRLAQRMHDNLLQKALNGDPESRMASYANNRIRGSLNETGRAGQRLNEVPSQELHAAVRQIGVRRGEKIPRQVREDAFRLTSMNVSPREARVYHEVEAAKATDEAIRQQHLKAANRFAKVDNRGLLTTDPRGNVIVDAEKYPRLARADSVLAKNQAEADKTLAEHGIMSEEGLATRVNAPARIYGGGHFEAPTPAKMGIPNGNLIRQRNYVANLEKAFEQAQAKGQYTERLGGALSIARDKLETLEKAAASRERPTGFVGGNGARQGRSFVTFKTAENKAPKNRIAASNSPVVGAPKSPISSKVFTGSGIEQGLIPDNTSRLAAEHFNDIARFKNTDEFRRRLLETGSDTRRSSRDVLIRNPDVPAGKIPGETEQLLGRQKSTVGELDEGKQKSFEDYVREIVPGLKDNFADDKAKGIGAKAPQGYRWVDQNLLGDLAKPTIGPRSAPAKAFDAINSAVTAATVYFKAGHTPTRALTNTVTNIVQGSARPSEIAKTVDLWHGLSHTDRLRAFAAAGQHGFESMPHLGEGHIAHIASKGANWWAKHIDAPFRFNSIAYEARRAGFDTPEKFRQLLDGIDNPRSLRGGQRAIVENVAKRANRENIAYDRLSPYEKKFLARGFWFYPWLRGTVNFAGNTILEHPVKSAVGASLGQMGRKQQANALGPVPSYEEGLIPFGRGSHPTVADFSTFTPFATPADIANALARPKQLSGFLNPVTSSAAHLMFGLNSFNQPTKTPLKDSLAELFSTTPEAQVISALVKRHQDQSNRMFHTTPLSALARTGGGPGLPRRVNKAALNSAAARESSGR